MRIADFIHQKPYEHILFQVRRHPITFVPKIILFFCLLIIPPILYWLISTLFPFLLDGQLISIVATFFSSIYYLSIVLFFYTEFVEFHLDMLIITNDRLIEVTQHSLFSRTIAEMDLYQTQDVISETKGFFPSLFRYGNLIIQNASATTKFHSIDVPHPDKLRQIVLDLATEDRKHHAEEEQDFSSSVLKPVSGLKK